MTAKKSEIKVTVKATTKTKKSARQLRVPLTQDQYIEFGIKLADAQGRIGAIEAVKESFMTQWKADMQSAEADVEKFASIIREKSLFREIGCTTEMNFKTKTITVTRDDTFEVLESRAMTSDELQQLPMEFDSSEKLNESPDVDGDNK